MKFSPRTRIVAGLAACVTALTMLPAQAATAYTTDAVTLRAGTNTGTAALATVPSGAAVNVECQARGQNISGTYTSDWWAKVNWGGRTGYLSRAYVRVPYGTNVPTCGSAPAPAPQPAPGNTNSTVVGGPVNLRDSTHLGANVLLTIPEGANLAIQCQARGQVVSGHYTSEWWAKVTYGGKTGWASRSYIRVPAGTNIPTCAGAPAPAPGNSAIDGPISRAEVLARGRFWVQRGVPYSQSRTAPDPAGKHYRADCSGLVSMAWHLSWTPNTESLTRYVHQIRKDDLRPGDAIGNLGHGTGGNNGHVVLFVRWTNDARTRFIAIEETGYPVNRAVEREHSWGTSFWNKKAYRYNKIVG